MNHYDNEQDYRNIDNYMVINPFNRNPWEGMIDFETDDDRQLRDSLEGTWDSSN